MLSETKYKSLDGERLKTLTPEEMLQILTITLAQVKAGKTSEKLLSNYIII